MNAQELLVSSLNDRWKKYRAALIRCRTDFSQDTIHSLRLATRRLLAVLDLLRAITPDRTIQKFRRELKELLDSLDEVRDVQITLEAATRSSHKLPELAPFNEFLRKRDKRLMRVTKKGVKELKIVSFTKRLDQLHKLLETLAPTALELQLFQVVDNGSIATTQLYAEIDPAHTASIHRLRVAFKKLRYLIELIFPLVANFPEGNLKKMHDYQSSMGEIQDTDVLLKLLKEFSISDSTHDLSSVYRYYKKRETILIARYLRERAAMLGFWRVAPDRKFPWENRNESISDPPRHRS